MLFYKLYNALVFLTVTPVATEANPFSQILKPVIELLDSVKVPAITLVGAIGAIYCIFLGVKLAQAEEPQDRDKAKGALKNAIIGFVLIFVLIVVLTLALPLMTGWMNTQTSIATPTP